MGKVFGQKFLMGKVFGQTPPTPGGGASVELSEGESDPSRECSNLCFTFSHSRKPYGYTPHAGHSDGEGRTGDDHKIAGYKA